MNSSCLLYPAILRVVLPALFLFLSHPLHAGFTDGQRPDIVRGSVEPPPFNHSIYPWAIAVDAAHGKVYVTTSASVLRYSWNEACRQGGVPEAVLVYYDSAAPLAAHSIGNQCSLCTDAAGRLYVCDLNRHRVLRFDSPWNAPGGTPANAVLGQAGFGTNVSGTGPAQMNYPWKLAHDGQALYVVDGGQTTRILRFDNAGTRPSGSAADAIFTTPGKANALGVERSSPQSGTRLWVGIIQNDNGVSSSRLIWYPNANTAPTGTAPAGTWGMPHVSAATLPTAVTGPATIGCDAAGGWLYIADAADNRVACLSIATALSGTGSISAALGQPDLVSRAAGMELSRTGVVTALAFVEKDGQKHLFVTDYQNQRVVRWVEPQFAGTGSGALHGPGAAVQSFAGVAVHADTGMLFASTESGEIHRYLPLPGGGYSESPDVVFGRKMAPWSNLHTPSSLLVTTDGSLIVSDTGNHRVLLFTGVTGAISSTHQPSGVLGQTTMTGDAFGSGMAQLDLPLGLALDPGTGTLWLADARNHRVLGWKNGMTRFASASKTADFIRGVTGSEGTTASLLDLPYSVAIGQPSAGAAMRLYVADYSNHRVLYWDNPEAAAGNSSPAHGVIGQANFLSKASTGPVRNPASLHISPLNRKLYVGNSGYSPLPHRIYCCRESSPHVPLPAPGLPGPDETSWDVARVTGLATDSHGHLWVAAGNNGLLRYANQSQHLTAIIISATGHPRIFFQTDPSTNYHIYKSDDLLTWTLHGSMKSTAFGSSSLWQSPNPVSTAPRRFFKVLEP